MKKIFTITSVFALGLLIAFACKKSTTTTPVVPTPSTTAPNTSVTSLSSDGTAITSLTVEASPMNTNEYVVNVHPTTGNQAPEIFLTFPGPAIPASGSYTISTYNSFYAPTANHCYLQDLTDASNVFAATSGLVTVTTGTPNIAYFTNISCANTNTATPGSHSLTGVFRY